MSQKFLATLLIGVKHFIHFFLHVHVAHAIQTVCNHLGLFSVELLVHMMSFHTYEEIARLFVQLQCFVKLFLYSLKFTRSSR